MKEKITAIVLAAGREAYATVRFRSSFWKPRTSCIVLFTEMLSGQPAD